MSDLFPIRDFIAANSDNAGELRARWAAEQQSAQPRKESIPVNTATSNYLNELVAEQIEAIDTAARAAKSAADDAERARVKSLNADMKKHFAKLIDKSAATVSGGELYFDFNGEQYLVCLKNGSFSLQQGATVITTFNADGDAIQSLAKVLAKLKAGR
jgi:hypothetical protein